MTQLINITDQIEKRLEEEKKVQYIPKDETEKLIRSMAEEMVIAKREADRNQRLSRNSSAAIILNSFGLKYL